MIRKKSASGWWEGELQVSCLIYLYDLFLNRNVIKTKNKTKT